MPKLKHEDEIEDLKGEFPLVKPKGSSSSPVVANEKSILRSIIDFGGVDPQHLVQNLQRLQTKPLDWRPADRLIYDVVVEFFQDRVDVPSGDILREIFEAKDSLECVERLKDVEGSTPHIHSNFAFLVDTVIEEQNQQKALRLLRTAEEIIKRGSIVEGERLQGVKDALTYFTMTANALIVPSNSAKLEGNIRDDAQAILDDYHVAKTDKSRAYGKLTGLNSIDTICRGIKKGELWVHAGAQGHLKSAFAMNWCYNLVTRYRTNVYFVSLEMPYEQIRRIIYTMHSANLKWRSDGLNFAPLDYRKIRDGLLTEEEEAFFKLVVADFYDAEGKNGYGRFDIWRPAEDATIDDIKTRAELIHKSDPLGLIVIDHSLLLEPRKKKRSKEYTIEMNSIVRDAKKRLAMDFNGGEGIGVLLLVQINRAGLDLAEKNGGVYNTRCLSYANEAERSADVITTTFLDEAGEHRRNGTVFLCNLKNRDNPFFEPFIAAVDFSCRRIRNLDGFTATARTGASTGTMTHADHRAALEMMQHV